MFHMAAAVGIISSSGVRIEACCRNQPNEVSSLHELFKTAVHRWQDKVL